MDSELSAARGRMMGVGIFLSEITWKVKAYIFLEYLWKKKKTRREKINLIKQNFNENYLKSFSERFAIYHRIHVRCNNI